MSGRKLIVDDEEDMRILLSMVINTENRGLHVVGEAAAVTRRCASTTRSTSTSS